MSKKKADESFTSSSMDDPNSLSAFCPVAEDPLLYTVKPLSLPGIPHLGSDYGSDKCAVFCCAIKLTSAVMVITLLDAVSHSAQLYRFTEIAMHLGKCNHPLTTFGVLCLIALFLADLTILVLLATGFATSRHRLIVPALYRYVISIVFDVGFIAYVALVFLLPNNSLKRPIIWAFKKYRACVIESNITYEISFHAVPTEFDEHRFEKQLDGLLLGFLCLFMVQVIFQVWFLTILRHFTEYLHIEDQIRKRRQQCMTFEA